MVMRGKRAGGLITDEGRSPRHFTADAAHELRTPLAAIRANAQVMQGARSPEEFSTAASDLLIGVDRSGRLIEQLLALARLDSGSEVRQRFTMVDLATLVCSQVEEQEPFAARRHTLRACPRVVAIN